MHTIVAKLCTICTQISYKLGTIMAIYVHIISYNLVWLWC